jgi:hypothetical protein
MQEYGLQPKSTPLDKILQNLSYALNGQKIRGLSEPCTGPKRENNPPKRNPYVVPGNALESRRIWNQMQDSRFRMPDAA